MQSGGTTISGVVEDEAGRPVAQASLYFISAPVPLPDIAALSGDDGSFALSVPAPGTYRLGVRGAGYAPGEVEVEAGGGDEPLLVRLKKESHE